MGYDRNVTGGKQLEEKPVHVRRQYLMGRLDQYVATVGKAQNASRLEAVQKIGRYVCVAPRDKPAIDMRRVQFRLKLRHAASNVGPGVGIDPWENVWRA